LAILTIPSNDSLIGDIAIRTDWYASIRLWFEAIAIPFDRDRLS
jgi:hypothetical protein